MANPKKQSTEAAVREIRRRSRRKFSPEEKIRIVLEGLRGEQRSRRPSVRLQHPGILFVGRRANDDRDEQRGNYRNQFGRQRYV
jgi:transposase-like protein